MKYLIMLLLLVSCGQQTQPTRQTDCEDGFEKIVINQSCNVNPALQCSSSQEYICQKQYP